jgi:hypothetical protein
MMASLLTTPNMGNERLTFERSQSQPEVHEKREQAYLTLLGPLVFAHLD